MARTTLSSLVPAALPSSPSSPSSRSPGALPRVVLLLALLSTALGSFGCTANTPRKVYRMAHAELRENDGKAALNEDVRGRMEARYAQVIAWHNAGEINDPEQLFWAGALLMNSWTQEHLVLARAIGQSAAQQGEVRGNVVAAQAIDKLNMINGEPQRYGTLNVYVPVLRAYRIYEIDPLTTDEDRQLMGIPPLAELHALLEQQNVELTAGRGPEGDAEKPSFLQSPVAPE